MEKIINSFLLIFKLILLLISFILSGYIVLKMYSSFDRNLLDSILYILPYIILITLFIVNVVKKQDCVNKNIFYNITCILVSIVIIIVSLRTMFDKNLLLNDELKFGINFMYFSDFLIFMKIMLYGLALGNILFIFKRR